MSVSVSEAASATSASKPPLRDARRRTEEVTASPRVVPLAEAAIDERVRAAMERLHEAFLQPERVPVHHFFATLSHSPEISAAYLQLGSDLATASALPARERELAILRTGWLCGAPYQWGEHVRTARLIGITAEEIERLRTGSAAPGWSAAEAALLEAVEELHRNAMIADATWCRLAAQFEPRQLIELTMLVGHYHTTAFVQNALRIGLNPGNLGLMAD